MKHESLHDLLVEDLKDLYSAEKQLTKALPKMAKTASAPQLRSAFTEHLRVTEQQIKRLDQVFKSLDASPRGKKCVAMEGLVAEGQELIKEKKDFDKDTLDAALIGAAQKVEHYEIASYGTVRTYARLLGYNEAARLLQQTLDEEADTDKKLTQLATKINVEAADGEEDEE